MDGHVEVAKLLLDHGAEVNMPADSFESPLTLAACGGHVELAMLLIERGANLEEVNDEGYTPLMEASREGHEEMVALLLSQGADINAQTEETQETALTLACCGGFLEVRAFICSLSEGFSLNFSGHSLVVTIDLYRAGGRFPCKSWSRSRTWVFHAFDGGIARRPLGACSIPDQGLIFL